MDVYRIWQVTETITTDQQLYVKLRSNYSPLALPEFFHKGSGCCLKRKSVLEILPSYVRNRNKNKNISTYILDKLYQMRFKKPMDKPKYFINCLLHFLLLRYTSTHVNMFVFICHR